MPCRNVHGGMRARALHGVSREVWPGLGWVGAVLVPWELGAKHTAHGNCPWHPHTCLHPGLRTTVVRCLGLSHRLPTCSLLQGDAACWGTEPLLAASQRPLALSVLCWGCWASVWVGPPSVSSPRAGWGWRVQRIPRGPEDSVCGREGKTRPVGWAGSSV